MAAIENLATNVDRLSVGVDRLIAKANQPPAPTVTGVPEADVQAQADRVAGLAAKVDAAAPPPAA